MSVTVYHDEPLASGVTVHYATSGAPIAPVVLLLHGYPSSSFQYRNLIPLLSPHYRVIAPDLPGFGHTTYPSDLRPNFDLFATVIGDLLDALEIKRFAVYIFDYGAPTALRLALRRPESVAAIISQNGNAYEEGFGPDFWAPLQKWWASGQNRGEIRDDVYKLAGDVDFTKTQYTNGTPQDRLDMIDPNTWMLDYLLHVAPHEAREVQLDLFWDYRTNITLYPQFQELFRTSQVPLLAVWGQNDPIFIPPGAEAYKRDLPNAKVVLLDGGHFLLETHLHEVADEILNFLATVTPW